MVTYLKFFFVKLIFKKFIYIAIYKIGSQWEFAVWFRKLKQGLCINVEAGDGEGDGREVQKGRVYMYTYG